MFQQFVCESFIHTHYDFKQKIYIEKYAIFFQLKLIKLMRLRYKRNNDYLAHVKSVLKPIRVK